MSIDYTTTSNKNAHDMAVVKDGLRLFNEPYFKGKPKFNAIYAKTPEKVIIGGALTYIAGQEMHLDTLWVDREYRNKGIGRNIVHRVFDIAKTHEIVNIFTDTYSFQAEGFYLKLGFEIYGKIDGYLAGHSKIYLKKIF